jgi:Coenzyme F420-dependent N5,N10-methylene tetrahydromethanopterin reductase and related flavin-dependent oxidoreductases
MKKIGFLSFGFWMQEGSMVKTAEQSYNESVDLAVEAEKLGVDGAWFRVHHFANQIGSPFPLLSAIGAKTSKIEIGTGIIDMRYENPQMMAENAGLTDILTKNRVQLGIGRGSPEQVLDGWKYFGYNYSEEAVKSIARERTLEFLELIQGKRFAKPNPMPMFPQDSNTLLRIEPYSPDLQHRIWWGAGSQETAIWAAQHGMNLESSTLVNYESNEPFHIQQANQLRAYKEAWKKCRHNFEPRSLVTRSIIPITNDLDRQLFSGSESEDSVGYLSYHKSPTIFGKAYASEPEQIVKDLKEDEAIQEADTILITIPNTLGIDYNVHLLESIMKDIAPDLGWKL